MAHFPSPWLHGPPTGSNVFCANFNTNSGNIRSPLQSFQRNPTVPFHSFPVNNPPPISPGAFPNRPRFQNFSDLSSPAFGNRQSAFERMPPPNIRPPNMPPSNMPTIRPHFSAAGNFENRPTPWHQTDNFIRNRSQFTNRPQPRDFNKFKKNDRKFKRKDNRKFKDDTTEKPFYCDTCDRAYALENELQSHLMEHTKCDFAGCCFEAHPKIVALHKKMQHDTGYADVINKLQDSEEIKKWREERRKRFPTAENIKKRKAEQAEKEARGEVLETKDFGKFKRRKFDPADIKNKNVRNRGNRFHRSKTHQRRNEKFSQPVASKAMITVSDTDSDSDSHISLPKFLGMSSVNANSVVPNASGLCNLNVDSLDLQSESVSEVEKLSCVDKEFLNDKSESCEVPPVNKVSLPLSNLNNEVKESDSLCQLNGGSNNGSDDLHVSENIKSPCHIEAINIESDDEPPTVLPILKTTVTGNSNSVDNPDSDDEPPTVIPIIKSSIESSNSVDYPSAEVPCSRRAAKGDTDQRHIDKGEGNINPKRFEKNNKKIDPPAVPVRKSTLLEKLLADDIRHERNVILQCIRHIVKKNFFGIGGAVKWKSP
ncbi:nuclear fragile X mental retardation-interacting protein 1-like [Stegodyphus dumicola]|uniref:nuclear fragile X mental retardation-interacting protein 1-like n=1 Tax=Stegodyphus dumicola TaxID=202533 RepID=UPI0015ADEAB9|nr:nuclear fragile X mental retardation-interacting protein 1-like [Stegodyphus dumicola]